MTRQYSPGEMVTPRSDWSTFSRNCVGLLPCRRGGVLSFSRYSRRRILFFEERGCDIREHGDSSVHRRLPKRVVQIARSKNFSSGSPKLNSPPSAVRDDIAQMWLADWTRLLSLGNLMGRMFE